MVVKMVIKPIAKLSELLQLMLQHSRTYRRTPDGLCWIHGRPTHSCASRHRSGKLGPVDDVALPDGRHSGPPGDERRRSAPRERPVRATRLALCSRRRLADGRDLRSVLCDDAPSAVPASPSPLITKGRAPTSSTRSGPRSCPPSDESVPCAQPAPICRLDPFLPTSS